MEWLYGIIAGYVSVPVASLLKRKGWTTSVKFLSALGIAVGGAFLAVWLNGDALTKTNVLAALGIAFSAQQSTFHLRLPGAGSETVNAALENVPVLPE